MCISFLSELPWNPINLAWSIFQTLIDQLSVWTFPFYFFPSVQFGQIKTVFTEEILIGLEQIKTLFKEEEILLGLYPAGIQAGSQQSDSGSIADKCSFFQTFAASLTAAFVNTTSSLKWQNFHFIDNNFYILENFSKIYEEHQERGRTRHQK